MTFLFLFELGGPLGCNIGQVTRKNMYRQNLRFWCDIASKKYEKEQKRTRLQAERFDIHVRQPQLSFWWKPQFLAETRIGQDSTTQNLITEQNSSAQFCRDRTAQLSFAGNSNRTGQLNSDFDQNSNRTRQLSSVFVETKKKLDSSAQFLFITKPGQDSAAYFLVETETIQYSATQFIDRNSYRTRHFHTDFL